MQRLLKSPRQIRIASQSQRRGLLNHRWLWVLLIVVLLSVLGVALLFLQANKAASDLKSANQINAEKLRSAVKDTSKTVNSLNIQNDEQANKLLASLTQLTTTVDSVSEVCADAAKPYITAMAKNYDSISNECDEVARGAREVRDAINAFMPVVQYQIGLTKALGPVAAYHSSDDKTDIDKGVAAWQDTRSRLQKLSAPESLAQNNSDLINNISVVVTHLQQAKASKDADNNPEYSSNIAALEQKYLAINGLAKPIRAQLEASQKELTAAVKTVR